MAFNQSETYLRLFGTLHVGDRNLSTGDLAASGLRHLGDSSELSVQPSQSPVEHRESQTGKQFVDDQVDGMLDCAISITLDNLGVSNMVTFLQGTQAAVASGSVSAEAKTAPAAGQSFLLDNPFVSAFTSLTGAGGTPVYTAADYIRDGSQIYIPAGSALAAGGGSPSCKLYQGGGNQY